MTDPHVLTYDDLLHCGWEEARSQENQSESYGLWISFKKAADKAMLESRKIDAQALELLSIAVSMPLRAHDKKAPIQSDRSISLLPQDLSEQNLEAMLGACRLISDPWMKARLADIVWEGSRPRKIEAGKIACDAYISMPLDSSNWFDGSLNCWRRAVVLCRSFGRAGLERVDRIETLLLDRMRQAQSESDALINKISELLQDGQMAKSKPEEVAKILRDFADAKAKENPVVLARQSYQFAAQWYEMAGDIEQKSDCLCAAAETHVYEAEMRVASDHTGHMAAGAMYEDAIQAFRQVPNAQREARSVENRIAEIQRLLKAAGEKTVEQMVTYETGSTNVTDIAEKCRDYVRGKPIEDAIQIFTNIHRDLGKAAHYAAADEFLQSSSIQTFISKQIHHSDGRIVAIRPGVISGVKDTPEYEIAIWAEAVERYLFDVNFAVSAGLYPAYEIVTQEHSFSLEKMIDFVRRCQIIPLGREKLVAKGLLLGFQGDFQASVHLIAPQIENLVRWHLNKNGVNTRVVNKDGTAAELGLSNLAKLPQFDMVFGENLGFEVQALFCDPFGPNIRNEIAHGLVDSNEGVGVYDFYAWWLLTKLVFGHMLPAKENCEQKS
jgi:hypothetical protein